MTTVHEHEEARGGNGALVLRPGLERTRERGRGTSEGECWLRGAVEDLAA
jgi:hypothetical protein